MPLLLNINDDQLLEEPDDDGIRAGVASLENEQYAILSRADEDYIQVYRHDASDFQLEYRAGSDDEHYGATTPDFSVEQIQQAFLAYASGKQDWQAAWAWEKMDI